MAEKLPISVVVCTKNSVKTIKECIESIIRNEPSEIIIVDGGSTDGTVDIVRKFTDKIFFDRGKGLGYARQLGAEKANMEYVAYIDSDVVLPTNSILKNMLREIIEKNWDGIHAQIICPSVNNYWEWGEDLYFRFGFNQLREVKRMGTIVALLRRELIIKYKFDPFFVKTAEDHDFYYRCYTDGCKFGISKEVACHYHRSSFKSFMNQKIRYGMGIAQMFWKYRTVKSLFGIPYTFLKNISIALNHRQIKLIPYFFFYSLFELIGFIEELGRLLLISRK